MRSVTVTRSSTLGAPAESVWSLASTPAGVNEELGPWLRMTFPARVGRLTTEEVVLGELVCRCWMLAGGVVPIDRHALVLASIRSDHGPEGFGFVEESTSWVQLRWRHERSVLDGDGETCEVSDVVTFSPRLGFVAPVVARLVAAVFAHRHRRLASRWGRA